MKRALSLLLAAVMLLSLSACGKSRGDQSAAFSADELARSAVTATGRDVSSLQNISGASGDAALASYVENAYGVPQTSWSDGQVYRAGGAEVYEVAVLQLTDEANADTVRGALERYMDGRESDFAGYNPAQAAIVSDAIAAVEDGYAVLLICDEAELAHSAVVAVMHGETPPTSAPRPEPTPTPTPVPTPEPTPEVTEPPRDPVTGRILYVDPEIDDMSIYDTSAVLSAWEAKDPSALNAYDRAIYDGAAAVLAENVTDNMTDFGKEYVLYAWLTKNVGYDPDHHDPLAEVSRDSYTPYGAFVAHKAVCLGAASSFQLLMDMADVECITVIGASRESTRDHAWNMVYLDGQWYCVDPTWDLYTSYYGSLDTETEPWGDAFWSYFNITSDRMAETDHQWDYASVPEAVSTTPPTEMYLPTPTPEPTPEPTLETTAAPVPEQTLAPEPQDLPDIREPNDAPSPELPAL